MNKVQRSKGQDPQAGLREAAREAAQRQGTSVGEWLRSVLSERAEQPGSMPQQPAATRQDGSKPGGFEQIATHPRGGAARRGSQIRSDRGGRLRFTDDLLHDDEFAKVLTALSLRRAGARSPALDFAYGADEDLLEEALANLERRAARRERRTDRALASMAKLLEESQERRHQDDGDVEALAFKMRELEAKIKGQPAPLKGRPASLARLEARLDAIGKGSAASASVGDRHDVAGLNDEEPIQRLEHKLNTILDAVQSPGDAEEAQSSSAAITAVRSAPSRQRRSLGEAIADISRRQRALDDGAQDAAPIATGRSDRGVHDDDAEALVASLCDGMAHLSAKVDDVLRNVSLAQQASLEAADGDLALLRTEVGAISRTLADLAPRDSVDALQSTILALADRFEAPPNEAQAREVDLRPIEDAVADLRNSLHLFDSREAIGGMEQSLRRMGDRIEVLSGYESLGFERLQSQLEDLRSAVTAIADRPPLLERVEHQVSMLITLLDRPNPGPELEHDIASATNALRLFGGTPAQLSKIESRLDALAGRVEQALARVSPMNDQGAERNQLEDLIRDLDRRFNAANAPEADQATLETLRQHISVLSDHIERLEPQPSKLPSLAASMRALMAAMEASATANEAGPHKRSVDAEQESVQAPSLAASDTALRSDGSNDKPSSIGEKREQAGHTFSTADGTASVSPQPASPVSSNEPSPNVRDVVGAMERIEIAGSETSPPSPLDPEFRLGGVEARDAVAGPRRRRDDADFAHREQSSSAKDEGHRSDFIAAARRAAAAAQAEIASSRGEITTAKTARANLAIRSRDYLALHKKPVLMSAAAILMALGVISLMGRAGDFGGNVDVTADAGNPTKVASIAVDKATIAAKPAIPLPSGALTPSVAAKAEAPLANAIPGSDPIQTGSIPKLPTFAVGAAVRPPLPPIPAALIASAEGGDHAAQFVLAMHYAEGRGVPRDVKLAAVWFEKAADAGSVPAEYRLASLYEKGIGVAVDKAKARALYTKAAEAGNPRAMHNLAVLLADNDGHPDYAAAIGWFKKAAQFGVHDSQYNLAVLLGRGLGAPQNLVQSYQWFAVAAAAQDAEAQKRLDEVAQKLPANDLAVAKALAAAFQPKTPDPSAVDVAIPPGGWDGLPGASRLNSARSKVSSL